MRITEMNLATCSIQRFNSQYPIIRSDGNVLADLEWLATVFYRDWTEVHGERMSEIEAIELDLENCNIDLTPDEWAEALKSAFHEAWEELE